MPYADAFTGGIVAPANLTYLSLPISVDTTLAWPVEQAVSGNNIVAEIIDVAASTPGLNINLPDARQVSEGYTALFNNVGANTVTVRDSAAGTLVSLASGTVWQLYLTDNSTAAGTWRVFQFGASVSVTNAAALAGAGLKAISTTLNLQLTAITTASSPITIVNGNRAQVIRWTGAAGVANLPAVGVVGADYFVIIRNDGSGDLTVTPAAGIIDGAATKTFPAGSSAWVVSDGTNWFTLGFGSGAGGSSGGFDFVQIDVSGSGNFVLSGVQLNRVSYRFIGVLSGDRSIVVPNAIQEYWVTNATTGAFNFFVKTAAQVTPVQILQNNSGITYCDGNNVIDAESSTVTFPISVALGGTGANNAATARINLGVSYAAPTGLVGPVAVTGAVGSVMDSGSAPAINLTAAYTWTGAHLFNLAYVGAGTIGQPAVGMSSSVPMIAWNETDAAANNRLWQHLINSEQSIRRLSSDDLLSATAFEVIDRTGNVCDRILWTATDFDFVGTTLQFNGLNLATVDFQVNSQSANYTTVLSDDGKTILHPNGAGAGDTITIAANASVAYPVGAVLTFVNRDSNSVTIAINTDTLVFTGSTATGSRTLGQNGIATALKIETTTWLISGVGLT